MPDAPIGVTDTIELGLWAEGANPGNEALNANWTLIDEAILALMETIDGLETLVNSEFMDHDTEFPETYAVGKLFLKTNEDDAFGTIYVNEGTFEAPEFNAVLSAQDVLDEANDVMTAALSVETTARINGDNALAAADIVLAAADATEAATRAAADLEFLKLDGSRPMEATLDMDTNQIENVGNGTLGHHAVNKDQLEAALLSVVGLFGAYENVLTHNSADIGPGTSPQTYEGNVEDEITDGAMHDTVSNKDRHIAQQDALYIVEARFKVEGWYGCGIQFYKNGVIVPRHPKFLSAVGKNITFLEDTLIISLVANDYITAKVYGLCAPDSGKILADSSLRLTALTANGVGGGDFFADGSVPMTGDLDGGGNEAINFADGASPTSLATVGQVSDLVDDAVEAALIAEDISGTVDAAVAAAVAALNVRTVDTVQYTGADIGTPVSQTDIPSLSLTITPKNGTKVIVTFYSLYEKNAESNYTVTHWLYRNATVIFTDQTSQNGEPGHYRKYPITIVAAFTGDGTAQTIKAQHMGGLNRMILHGGALAGPRLVVDYVPA